MILKGLKRFFTSPEGSRTHENRLVSQTRCEGRSAADWVESRRETPWVYADISDGLASRLRQFSKCTELKAGEILRHQFSLLGAVSYTPIDPDRPVRPNGYRPIDWHLDPVCSLRFPRGIPHDQWKLYEMRPGNADIKLPWELARCQHFACLGQAYRLTGDERYAIEIADEILDFREANPLGIGINWTCSMDVAIRAVNWLIGLGLIRRSPIMQPDFWATACEALFEHGEFIYSNLENKYEITSNHYLSNVVGLFYLSAFFVGLPSADHWEQFCRRSLQEEIRRQVLDDGADFESSIPYHRLVLEMLLGAARLAVFRGQPLSEDFDARLKKMVLFLLSVMRPDGLMPQVGDADDGRLHILSDYGIWRPQDPRHILGPASFYFDEPSWRPYGGNQALWEAAWWGYVSPDDAIRSESLPPVSRFFPQAGLVIARHGENYLLLSNGVVGTKGFGNHKHNDQLSFELHLSGRPLIVDPGSYVYTSDPSARNLFRGTGVHNTLKVDDTEQNEVNPEWLFRMFESAHPEHLRFLATDRHVEYRGCHRGYERLRPPVVHERRIRFLVAEGCLVVVDCLSGLGQRALRWHFHAAPGVEVRQAGDGLYTLLAADDQFCLRCDPSLETRVVPASYSPSYGILRPCSAIEMSGDRELGGTSKWWFAIARTEWFESDKSREEMASIASELMDQ